MLTIFEGVTYFLMPVIYDSLKVHQHLSSHVAWRVAFIVPFILIVTTGVGMILFCQDTPTGKWSERHLAAQESLQAHGVNETIVGRKSSGSPPSSGAATPKEKETTDSKNPAADVEHGMMMTVSNREADMTQQQMLEVARGEIVVKPTLKASMKVLFSLQTMFHAMTYFCSFGAELGVNSYLGAYYLKNFPKLGQTGSGRWAAMFGLLNIVTRPLGGVVGDLIYKYTKNLWLKKAWITFVGIVSGAVLIAIGQLNPHHEGTMFGLVALFAIFLEAGNGANFGKSSVQYLAA